MGGLINDIARVLAHYPGLTARELSSQLPGSGKRVLNPLLYGQSSRFRNDGGRVPRWYLAEQTTDYRPERASITKLVDAERRLVDQQLEIMLDRSPTSYPAPSPVPGSLRWESSWCLPDLRPWQKRAVTAWIAAGGNGIIEAVTGTGKTHLGLEAAARMARMGGRTTILVPTIELQRQWTEKLAEHVPWLSLALVGGKNRGDVATADVSIAVAATASRRDLASSDRPHLVVADEAHRYGSECWSAALQPAYVARLGLTATLERGGDDGVDELLLPFFGSKVFTYTYEEAVPEGVVASFSLAFLGVAMEPDERYSYDRFTRRVRNARKVLEALGVFRGTPGQVQRNLQDCKRRGGDLRRAAVEFEKATRGRRNLLAEVDAKPDALGQLAPLVDASHGTVIFSQKIEAAKQAALVLSEHGVIASAIHSRMSAHERQFHLESLKNESIAALCAPRILDEGVDVPNLDLGIVLSASSGRRQMIQRLGRVIRLKRNGGHARFIVVFAAGTVEDPAEDGQLGFIDMVRNVATRESVLRPGWKLADVEAALDLSTRKQDIAS